MLLNLKYKGQFIEEMTNLDNDLESQYQIKSKIEKRMKNKLISLKSNML